MSTQSTDVLDQVGIREDLSNDIWNVDPTEVPFTSGCKRSSCSNVQFDWQIDDLAAVSADNAVEGADATFAAATPTTRLDNYAAIVQKTAITSGSLEATDRAGRGREMAYQVVKRAKEIKRDLEHQMVGLGRAKRAGGAGDNPATDSRISASYQSWVYTNRDAVGAAPTGDGTDIPADGVTTGRSFVESMLTGVIDQIWESGGNPDTIMCGSFNKRKLTSFAGNANTTNIDRDSKRVINAVSVYESDYGVLKVVPNRFVRDRDVLVFQSDMWKLRELRGMKNEAIAKTGDNHKRQVLIEVGLEACNEKASGIISDLLIDP